MSVVGSPIETSLLQAAQAQQTASKARDKERAVADTARRFKDLVELRVAGVESAEAVRQVPQNESQEAGSENQSNRPGLDEERPRVDVTA
ncbi:MAG: hypothetical protein JSV91_02640 [Phycisphaerales bacterium]|nr:MAG: hypothetical protein JSV91_02640 [Phycisphaerales bacterium]